MNLQYLSDSAGKTTGIFIPFKDWERLLKKYKGLVQEVNNVEVPKWHKKIVADRIKKYKNNQDKLLNWDDVEKKLDKKYE